MSGLGIAVLDCNRLERSRWQPLIDQVYICGEIELEGVEEYRVEGMN